MKKVIAVRASTRGEERLYDENISSTSSSAFSWIGGFGLGILKKILSGIGIAIDRVAEPITRYIPAGSQKQPTGYRQPQTVPAAAGYKTAAAMVPIPAMASDYGSFSSGYRFRRDS